MEALIPADRDLVYERSGSLGYLFFRAALDPEPLLALRAAALEREHDDPVARQAAVMVLPGIDALRRDPFVLGVLREVFNAEPLAEQGDVLRVVRPEDPPTPAHRDYDYIPDKRLWTVWIPLGDCPLELGGLAVQPRRSDVWAAADYACGDVLMFASRTPHRAGENRTDRVRVSIDFRYVPILAP